jgi:glycosyltransferase involved in cell wall biosynthesis
MFMNLVSKVLTAADKAIFVSHGIRNMTINEFKDVPLANKTKVITNGFDEDDFHFKREAIKQEQHITFSYIGTMFGPQTHHKLIEGIGYFIDNYLKKDVKVRFDFLGTFAPEVLSRVKESWKEYIHFLPPASHTIALEHMYNASVLVLLLANSEEGKVAFSGKFFEYLKIGRPILALVPEGGEVANIITEYTLGKVVTPDDEVFIGKSIAEMINSSNKFISPPSQLLKQFSREELTNELIQLIHQEA